MLDGKKCNAQILKLSNTITRWLKMNSKVLSIAFLLICPYLLSIVYKIFHRVSLFEDLELNSLLEYYGVVASILCSFLLYRAEVNKKEERRKEKIKPRFTVKLVQGKKPEIFELELHCISRPLPIDIYLYGTQVKTTIKDTENIEITASAYVAENEGILYVESLGECIDEDGYPKYIQISATDYDNNIWEIEYKKHDDVIYLFHEAYIIQQGH